MEHEPTTLKVSKRGDFYELVLGPDLGNQWGGVEPPKVVRYDPISLQTVSRDTVPALSSESSSSESSAPRSLLGMLTDVQNGISKQFRERTRHLGISRSQWRVLTTLASRPGATQTEIAELIGIGRAPLGKNVDRLEAQGWVERRNDPEDRRVNRLYLSRDMEPIAEPTRRISNEIVDELIEDLPLTDQAAFRRTLVHLHRKLGFSNNVEY